MTLIMAATTAAQTVVVADRRITGPRGALINEETGKLALALFDDARMAIAYTGLAEYGTFKTRHWLAEALSRIHKTEHRLDAVVDALARDAEMTVAKLGLRPQETALTVLLAGYRYPDGVTPVPTYARISNFERTAFEAEPVVPGRLLRAVRPVTPEFSVDRASAAAGFTVGAGTDAGMTFAQVEELRSHMRAGASGQALRAKIVHLVRTAAANKASGGVIGEQCSSLIIPSSPAESVQMDYHTATATRAIRFPGQYDMRSPERGGGLMVWDAIAYMGTPEDPPVLVPQAARKSRCPCGSGRQYRRCHGRPSKDEVTFRLGGPAT